MHAAGVVETLPAAGPDDDVLSAIRMVCQHGLPGLVIADGQGEVIGCLSSIDLVRLALPRYLQDDPGLARVFDEQHADRVAAELVGIRIRDVAGRAMRHIPTARPRASLVEVGELMVQQNCPLVPVRKEGGGTLGIVTANRLLGLLAAAVEDA
jgi:CBS domain-containing protein